jgi:hypothetical protein
MAQYLHLIRGPDDPERSPRPPGGLSDRSPHLSLAKTKREDWRRVILEHLSDGIPRRLNRIGVELLDHTADILFGSQVDEALWSLVADRLVEHTLQAPISFRIRRRTRKRNSQCPIE